MILTEMADWTGPMALGVFYENCSNLDLISVRVLLESRTHKADLMFFGVTGPLARDGAASIAFPASTGRLLQLTQLAITTLYRGQTFGRSWRCRLHVDLTLWCRWERISVSTKGSMPA